MTEQPDDVALQSPLSRPKQKKYKKIDGEDTSSHQSVGSDASNKGGGVMNAVKAVARAASDVVSEKGQDNDDEDGAAPKEEASVTDRAVVSSEHGTEDDSSLNETKSGLSKTSSLGKMAMVTKKGAGVMNAVKAVARVANDVVSQKSPDDDEDGAAPKEDVIVTDRAVVSSEDATEDDSLDETKAAESKAPSLGQIAMVTKQTLSKPLKAGTNVTKQAVSSAATVVSRKKRSSADNEPRGLNEMSTLTMDVPTPNHSLHGEAEADEDGAVDTVPEEEESVPSKTPSLGKIATATKKTLSKPLKAGTNVTKKAVSSAATVVSRKKRSSNETDNEPRSMDKISTLTMDVPTPHVSFHGEEADQADGTTTTTDDATPEKSNVKSSQKSLSSEASKAVMIYMGPALSFLLHDATLAIGASLLIATYPTVSNYRLIVENRIPLSVTFTWVLFAFVIGYEVALFKIMTEEEEEVSIEVEDITIPKEIELPSERKSRFKKGYSVLRRVSMKLPVKVKFQEKKFKNVWTALRKSDRELECQRAAHDQVNERLMRRLLRNTMYRRRPAGQPLEEKPAEGVGPTKATKLGSFELPEATTLKEIVIDPLFVLRGMDIFMSENEEEGAEDNMAAHPYLLANGVRDAPMFIVNLMTQWANVLLYFEMPAWVKDWGSIIEQDDDPDDVKALKMFLNGDEEYRNERLKLLPSLVDGPLPVRMLAPPKKEMTIHCTMLPAIWRQHSECNRSDGKFLYPCLELELDLMANKAIRGMASLVKRYLHTISVDIAVTIDKPDLQVEDELSACVGMWRFDKVDISRCPKLPPRMALGRSVRADTIRASMWKQSLAASMAELEALPEAQEVGA